MSIFSPIIITERFRDEERYHARGVGGGGLKLPVRDRLQQGAHVLDQLRAIWAKQDEILSTAADKSIAQGCYVDFRGKPGYDLVYKSLEDGTHNVRLSNVSALTDEDGKSEIRATLFLPSTNRNYLEKKCLDYLGPEKSKSGRPLNQDFIESIERVDVSTIESLWTDSSCDPPQIGGPPVWCEVWLRENESAQPELPEFSFQQLRTVADEIGLELDAEHKLCFPGLSVCLVRATHEQLVMLMERLDCISEFRLAKDTADAYLKLSNREQVEWARDLIGRIDVSADANVVVTVLDTGANNAHPLLVPLLSDDDCNAVDPRWTSADVDGHGTEMCGIAAFGDLSEALSSRERISISHRLESIKILPDRGKNPPELYGAVTALAINIVEKRVVGRKRVCCLATTAREHGENGEPSSWSGAIDTLASGAMDGVKRLIVVSAGNVEGKHPLIYPNDNCTVPIQDPGQSWNAITIGAYTRKATNADQDRLGYRPLAATGQLSPTSTTSLSWNGKWPPKPDVVFEGGNYIVDKSGFAGSDDVVSLLTTSNDFSSNIFTLTWGTSPAAALAARFAAQVFSRYPDFWPETVRALMIHSARWTKGLKEQYAEFKGINLHELESKKTKLSELLRFCGWGVPDFKRAIECAENRLTLISQATIKPYILNPGSSTPAINEIHFYQLPWPEKTLIDMGMAKVTIRITLSYFIEPGPGRKGWKDRYRYPSHAFRFKLNRKDESFEEFKRRLNAEIQAAEDGLPEDTGSGTSRWSIGTTGRDLGSVHSDFFTTEAINLAKCNCIAVHPIGGWWKYRTKFERYKRDARYSLIVSLETEAENVNIYSPVKAIVDTPLVTPIVAST